MRKWIFLMLALPLLVGLAQVAHRMTDAAGSAPVRSVRPIGRSNAPPAAADPEFLTALGALAEITFRPGHQIELLQDGPRTLERLESDLRGARQSIVFQTYYCEPGRLAERLKQLLLDRARQGVRILFLRDAFGCSSLKGDYSDSLASAGVEVAVIRPLRWYSFHKAQHRSHVRSIVIDGRIGYTGGFGVADKWLPDSADNPGWRETSVRVTGPAVAHMAGAFGIAWSETTGELLTDGIFGGADSTPKQGPVAGLLFTSRQYGTPVPERYLALSLAAARRTVYIANPYFIPNREVRRWLGDAVRRGVDVRVVTTGGNTDVRFTHWAARTHYEELLEAGVKLYEYRPSMIHAKTMVIDGVFGSVGSMNLDNVSLRINDEAILLFHDSVLGAAMDSTFQRDLAQSDEIRLEEFRRRSLVDKIRESLGLLLRDFL